MSHFTCITVHKDGENPEELLAPFQENNMGDCPEEYLEFNDVEEEYLEKFQNKGIDMIEAPNGELLNVWDERFNDKRGGNAKVIPKGYKQIHILFKDKYKDFDEFMEQYGGYKKDESTGKYGYWENPNAKWDWYEMGGRWTGYFKLKKGAKGYVGLPGLMTEPAKIDYVDQIMFKDIDIEGMIEDQKQDREEKWKEIVKTVGSSDKNKISILEYTHEYKMNITKEEWMKVVTPISPFLTFAFIDHDGNWHEKGSMGWWGIVSNEDKVTYEEAWKRFMVSLEPDDILTVWDLHI